MTEVEAPKFLRVKRALQERIARGDYPPGSLLPSEKELMREFEGSRPTVSRALNELRAEGLIRREQGKGSFVNGAASLRNQIGILTYVDKTRPCLSAYPQNWLRTLMKKLHELHEEPRIFNAFGTAPTGSIQEHGQAVLEAARCGEIRCLVVENTYHAGEVEAALAPFGVAVVGSHMERPLSRFNVGLDNAHAVEVPLRHLLDLGCRKIGLMEARATHVSVHRQVQTYLRVMEEQRLAVRPGWICADEPPSPESGDRQFRRLWEMDDPPEALLVADDVMAQGAIRAMVGLELRVPTDLRVVVKVNRWSGLHFPIPITSMEIDMEPLGGVGAELAHGLVMGKQPELAQIWVKPRLQFFDAANPRTSPPSEMAAFVETGSPCAQTV